MNYIELELHDKGYKSIDIFYGDTLVKTVEIDSKQFKKTSTGKLYVDYDIEVENYQITLTIEINKLSILIVLEADSFDRKFSGNLDLNQFDFIPNSIEDEIQDTEESKLIIPFYMPTITYTNLASSIVFDIDNPNIVPLFDIDSEDRLDSYKSDDLINFQHFLDLEFMDRITNKAEIEEAIKLRKQEAKIHGAGNQITAKPTREYKDLDGSEIIQKYIEIKEKESIIPVLNWGRGDNIISDVKSILKDFHNVAIRVTTSYSKFNDFLKDLKEELKAYTSNIYIIFDMNNNFAIEQFDQLIESTSVTFKTIYLGAQFSASDISKKRKDPVETDINHISPNKPLEIFEKLLNETAVHGYGDYCGFDRKTITRSSGGRPTARVVLASVDKSKKMLVRRAWDNRDLKSNQSQGLIHSMNKLMLDIKNGLLDKDNGVSFLNEKNYDTDEALKEFYPDRPSAGILKTICLRHNYLSTKNNFMFTQNP
ncbi:MAG: hypothetical protein DRG78_22930 [Epsilonproteobacteria bacterium]|nr:MAG: hypothetical protein DRG78_22930 [Campylobacterota bacterium]